MAWSRLRMIGGWASLTVVPPDEWEAIDTRLASTIDAVGGGSYAPSAAITIGGSGLVVTGPLDVPGHADFTGGATVAPGGVRVTPDGTSFGTSLLTFSCTLPANFTSDTKIVGNLELDGDTSVRGGKLSFTTDGASFQPGTSTIGADDGTFRVGIPASIDHLTVGTMDATAGITGGAGATLAGSLAVGGAATVAGVLTVAGATMLNGSVTTPLLVVTTACTVEGTTGFEAPIFMTGRARIAQRVAYLSLSADSTVDLDTADVFVMKTTNTASHNIGVSSSGAIAGNEIELYNFDTIHAHALRYETPSGMQFESLPKGVLAGFGYNVIPGSVRLRFADDGLAGLRWMTMERIAP